MLTFKGSLCLTGLYTDAAQHSSATMEEVMRFARKILKPYACHGQLPQADMSQLLVHPKAQPHVVAVILSSASCLSAGIK